MAITPLTCDQCGAPVPLADGDFARCRHCGASVRIPESHKKLREEVRSVRERRRETEKLLRRHACLGSRRVRTSYSLLVIPAAVIGVPIAFALTQSRMHWYAREWTVLAGILPFMVTLLPLLVLWTFGSINAYLGALGLKLRPAPPPSGTTGFDCGVCGAPLEIEPDALAATCDYCGSDSWVRDAPESWELEGQSKREAANLSALVRASDFRRFDLRNLMIVYPTVTAIACGILWYALPGRTDLIALNYSESVGHDWELVGQPGPVVDLASSGEDLVAVGKGGQVLEWVGNSWSTVQSSSDFLGVGADPERVLVVGKHGKAAWLDDSKLHPVDVGLHVDLHDAWVSGQRAVVVGDHGESAVFEHGHWTRPKPAGGNDLVGVWGDGHGHVWSAGGIAVNLLQGTTWSSQTILGLPRVVAVSGNERGPYIATLPLDGKTHQTTVYLHKSDDWDFVGQTDHDLNALAGAPHDMWGVGPHGYVFRQGAWPPKHAPCKGDLHAAVFVHGLIVVGGDDGVFRQTEP